MNSILAYMMLISLGACIGALTIAILKQGSSCTSDEN